MFMYPQPTRLSYEDALAYSLAQQREAQLSRARDSYLDELYEREVRQREAEEYFLAQRERQLREEAAALQRKRELAARRREALAWQRAQEARKAEEERIQRYYQHLHEQAVAEEIAKQKLYAQKIAEARAEAIARAEAEQRIAEAKAQAEAQQKAQEQRRAQRVINLGPFGYFLQPYFEEENDEKSADAPAASLNITAKESPKEPEPVSKANEADRNHDNLVGVVPEDENASESDGDETPAASPTATPAPESEDVDMGEAGADPEVSAPADNEDLLKEAVDAMEAEGSEEPAKEDSNTKNVSSELEAVSKDIDDNVEVYTRIKAKHDSPTPSSPLTLSAIKSQISVLQKAQTSLENLYTKLDLMNAHLEGESRQKKHELTSRSVEYADKVDSFIKQLREKASEFEEASRASSDNESVSSIEDDQERSRSPSPAPAAKKPVRHVIVETVDDEDF